MCVGVWLRNSSFFVYFFLFVSTTTLKNHEEKEKKTKNFTMEKKWHEFTVCTKYVHVNKSFSYWCKFHHFYSLFPCLVTYFSFFLERDKFLFIRIIIKKKKKIDWLIDCEKKKFSLLLFILGTNDECLCLCFWLAKVWDNKSNKNQSQLTKWL